MFAGILGTWDLLQNVPQAIAVNDREFACAVIINVCNKGGSTALISIAIAGNSTSPADSEWIEWNTQLSPKNTLERQGILVPPGKYVIVRSNQPNVNSVVYGVQNGELITVAGITQNVGSAPTWVTSTSLPILYAGDSATSIQLSATDAESEAITYSITNGSFGTGVSMSPTGLITGTPTVVGYSAGLPNTETTATITATDSRSNATPRTFNITKRWADGSTQAYAAPNADIIKQLTGTTTNGNYWIQPPGQTAYNIYCDMTTNGGGWAMIAAGREGGPAIDGPNNWWRETGNGDLTTLSAAGLSTTSVRYMSTSWIRSYIGSSGTWGNMKSGMWVKRVNLGDSFLLSNNANSPLFTWSDFNVGGTAPISLIVTRYPNFTFSSPTYTLGGYFWTDTLNYGAPVLNDATRLFTWTWTGHSNSSGQYQGWSAGSSITTPGFLAATEGHALQLVNVFIK